MVTAWYTVFGDKVNELGKRQVDVLMELDPLLPDHRRTFARAIGIEESGLHDSRQSLRQAKMNVQGMDDLRQWQELYDAAELENVFKRWSEQGHPLVNFTSIASKSSAYLNLDSLLLHVNPPCFVITKGRNLVSQFPA